MKIKPYIKLLRVHHYIKNLLVYAALLCSARLFDTQRFAACTQGFIAFCLVSSCVYILNDIRDIEKDRLHPVKCQRPLASGAVSVPNAVKLFFLLLGIAVFINLFPFRLFPSLLLLLYLVINLGYSFGLKNIPLIDIVILVAGFVIRVLYGAAITDIPLSGWLYLTITVLSLFFALGKRRNELKRAGGGRTRHVLQYYSEDFLDKNMYMCLALANTFYALWCMDPQTIAHYHNENLVWTVPLILMITMKYSFDVEGESDGDPVEVLLHDRILMLLCLLYAVIMFFILYF